MQNPSILPSEDLTKQNVTLKEEEPNHTIQTEVEQTPKQIVNIVETKRSSVALTNDSAVESEGDDKIDIENNEYSMNVLNNVVINTVADRLITYAEASTTIEVDFFVYSGDSKMTQTELTLIGKLY